MVTSIKSDELEPNTITFKIENEPIIKLCTNGDIFVKSKLIENDKELVDGMREFLLKANSYI